MLVAKCGHPDDPKLSVKLLKIKRYVKSIYLLEINSAFNQITSKMST